MLDKIANGEASTILTIIMADFTKHDVKTKVARIEEDVKKVEYCRGGERRI